MHLKTLFYYIPKCYKYGYIRAIPIDVSYYCIKFYITENIKETPMNELRIYLSTNDLNNKMKIWQPWKTKKESKKKG